MNFIYSFVLGLAVASFGICSMQGRICWILLCGVCRYVGKIVELLAKYYLFLFTGRVPWSNSSTLFELVQPHLL